MTPVLLAALLAAPPADVPFGACGPATPDRIVVAVRGLKPGGGTVRVQIYDAAGFLRKGAWLSRVERPAGARDVEVCIAVPKRGRLAVAVRHDADGNGRSGWSDGGGFSRDPRLSLLHLRPGFDAVGIDVGRGTTRTVVTMNYRRGLSIGPAPRTGS